MNASNLCTACLCTDRDLTSFKDSELNAVYCLFLTEIPVVDRKQLLLSLCFECCARFRSFIKFQKRVVHNYYELQNYMRKGIEIQNQSSQLQTHRQTITCYLENGDDKDDVKAEIDVEDIKTEAVAYEDCHDEPETFANELEQINTLGRVSKADDVDDDDADDDNVDHTEIRKRVIRKKIKSKRVLVNKSSKKHDSDEKVLLKENNDLCVPMKQIVCNMCTDVFSSESKRQSHLHKCHSERPQCAECGKLFSSMKTYRYHLNVIHKGHNRFPCPQCGKVYQWKSNLWRHLKNHKARDSGELFCAECNKKFSSVATYQQHLKISRRHVTENEYNFVCSDCGKKFVTKTRLRDHVDWEHLNKINYRCQLCNKPFKSKTSLYVHLQNVHKSKHEKDNLCHVCGKSYQNIAKLKYHIVAMHTADTPYSCDRCPASFSWYSSLYRHCKEVHEKVKLAKTKKTKKSGDALPALMTQL